MGKREGRRRSSWSGRCGEWRSGMLKIGGFWKLWVSWLMEAKTPPPPNAADAVDPSRTKNTQPCHHVTHTCHCISVTCSNSHSARQSCYKWSASSKNSKKTHILRQNLDGTPSEPLIANPTNAILRDRHPAIAAGIASWFTISKAELRCLCKIKVASHGGYEATLADNGVLRPYSSLEIGFQIFQRQDFGDKI